MILKDLLGKLECHTIVSLYFSYEKLWGTDTEKVIKEAEPVYKIMHEATDFLQCEIIGILIQDNVLHICVYSDLEEELEEILKENKKIILESILPKEMVEDILNTITIAENDFVGVTVSTVYQFAPMYKPRKIDKIVEHIHEWFEKNRINKHFKPLIVVKNNLEEITKNVEEILLSCEEFKELNLSQREYEKGIVVSDKGRRNVFTGIGYKIDPLDDFIDLEACISSIAHKLKEWLE